ncbi:2-dehydro-3-deoxygluconokinase [Glaciihabitans tibetensis]|uniref:2-dehydro-3-deoxygluconokinase n=1 Tax=Glaciihabitans tibetensis TaxID=1266600 RepID=A0A2T0VE46_9MICO|nr:sugar kinase [Glaciihabitans tibetensis]PRY68453.1 2-dehydro-3-deoxygluconokinase [Glaciihabitans tibetensis]
MIPATVTDPDAIAVPDAVASDVLAPDVLCFGETMGMITPTQTQAFDEASALTLGTGGAESNVASHLAELGHRVAWAGNVGNDTLGAKIISTLDRAGVDTRWVGRKSSASTGLYLKEPDTGSGAHVFYYRAGSAASELSVTDAATWPLDSAKWIHTTGITPALSASCDSLVEYVLDHAAETGAQVSFDINYRAGLWPLEVAAPRLLDLARRATVVLVGLDEAQTLWGCESAADVRALMPDLPYLVVKDSSIEAVEFRLSAGEQTITRVPARRVEVVEPVGAGDAFAAGYLSALLNGATAADRLANGHSLAAWALGSREDFRPGHTLRDSADLRRQLA